MLGLRQLALLLAGGLALSGGPVLAAGKAPATPAAERDQALQAFQRDLVSVLALRGDATGLLGAALLARPLPAPQRSNDFHSLIARATAAAGHGPAQAWLQLADCEAAAGDCPNAAALDSLLVQAPDNAAVWLLKLGQDLRDMHRDAARADLRRAAAAKLYDDYTGISLQALARGVATLPPPPATLDAEGGAGAAGVQAMIVFGLAGTQPQPALQAAAQLCKAPGEDDALRADCLALGRLLEWGSSPLARSLGLHLRETLGDAPARGEATAARRDLVWQLHRFSQLLVQAQRDAPLARHLLALAGHGGTEMSLMLAALRDAGLPTTAPAGPDDPAP